MNSKKILLSIPEYMYKEIEQIQPYVTTTITGTIIMLLDHGLAYERKKALTKAKQKQKLGMDASKNPNQVTVDHDDYNTQQEITHTIEIAKTRWADGE